MSRMLLEEKNNIEAISLRISSLFVMRVIINTVNETTFSWRERMRKDVEVGCCTNEG